MRRARALALALAVALAAGAAPARAWEADTTHAGLTEQSALASTLHERLLEHFGASLGLYAPLTVPPKDAPELFDVLAQLNPTHGYVPDKIGRQPALGWLVVGSVIADIPVDAARNHFFDPATGKGLTIDGDLPGDLFSRRVALGYVGTSEGVAAPDWIESKDNPLNLDGFYAQYRKAVLARTPGERERHLAGALIAAGATLHVLQDMGSPSHVRNDFAAHMTRLSKDETDVGSRFERVAALAYGRLGVPAAGRTVTATRLRDFFATDDGAGLAPWTASRFFSSGTLPDPIEIEPGQRAADLGAVLAASLARPFPAPVAGGLNLMRAAGTGGATLVGEDDACIARYRVRKRWLRWSTDDQCDLDQAAAILPEVASYSTGLLEFLFRGSLALSRSDAGGAVISAGDTALGKGEVTVLWDDSRGVRTALVTAESTDGGTVGATLATVRALPSGSVGVAALFDGVDANGERVLAVGFLDLTAE